ncbi:uncharacterized protein LOC111693897 [Trichogramma pretiosum]|uniref:uncharacterized protein LOC111693897 n=1 Tax=Trichogramma pretiosum TaxID=7493 RepID=UPI000C71A16F|nr:uncharacterized protein LOC111693897 [Trichogramma pretiosum]
MLTLRNVYAKPTAAGLQNLYYEPVQLQPLRFEPSYGAGTLQNRFKKKLKSAAVASAAPDKVEKTLSKSQLKLEEELFGSSSKRKNQNKLASNDPKDARKKANEENNEYDREPKLLNDKDYAEADEADEAEGEDKEESKNKTSAEGEKEEKETSKNSLAQTSFR